MAKGHAEQSPWIRTLFQQAINRYLDENKPDPIVSKQMKAWSLDWMDNDKDEQNETETNSDYLLSGRLTWKSNDATSPLQVVLFSSCSWRGDKKDGSLSLECHVCITGNTSSTIPTTKDDKRQAKADEKIRKRLLKRFLQDDYIQKLYVADASAVKNTESTPILCQATVILKQASDETSVGDLEERVWTDEDVAEGIRRAVWNTTNDTIDVLEFLLSLPCVLPTTAWESAMVETAIGDGLSKIQTTALADRAQLRLLEDAMYDACEKEGEEEMVKGLDLEETTKKRSKATE